MSNKFKGLRQLETNNPAILLAFLPNMAGLFISSCLSLLLLLLLAQPSLAAETLDVSIETGQLILTPVHGGDGSAWGKDNCSACHFKTRIHKNAPAIRDLVQQVGFDSCTGCHGKNGSDAPRQCIICHNEQRLPSIPIVKGVESHNFNVNDSRAITDDNCVVCHQSSDMDGKFEFDKDLTKFSGKPTGVSMPYRNGVEFCLACHNETHQQPGFEMSARFIRDPLVKVTESYQYMDVHGYPRGTGEKTYSGLRGGDYKYGDLVECTDCHAMHGTHNKKLIVDRTDAGMIKLEPSLRDLPVLIDVVEGDYSQLCVTCHLMSDQVEQGNQDTGNGLGGVHEVGTDCRKCHVHGLPAQVGL